MKGPNHNRAKTGGHTRGPLIGWAAIADYLQCSERTARNWNTNGGLPIRRVGGTRIEASAAELDAWRARG